MKVGKGLIQFEKNEFVRVFALIASSLVVQARAV
jgi:hypothetical protein